MGKVHCYGSLSPILKCVVVPGKGRDNHKGVTPDIIIEDKFGLIF